MVPAVFAKQAAIIFPLFFYQFLRLKYSCSLLFKQRFDLLSANLESSKILFWLPKVLTAISSVFGSSYEIP